MSVSANLIPTKINDFRAYLNGTEMIGVGGELTLPEVNQKTSTIEGAGIGGEIDDPTVGQFESMEQEVGFNLIHSSFADMLSPMTVVNLTFRAAQQAVDKEGNYSFKGMRIVEKGRVKSMSTGKIVKGEGMECKVKLELTYLMVENDGKQLVEIDKLNGVYKVNGVDMLAEIRKLI